MKKIFNFIVVMGFLLIPALCFSAYLIHLKDGREFTVDRYREDGGQIKLELPSGELGVPKNMVDRIEGVEDIPIKGKAVEQRTPPPTEPPEVKHGADRKDASEAAGTSGVNSGEKPQTEIIEDETLATDANRYQDEKKALMEKKRALEEAYDRAREAGDMPERMRIERALQEIDEKLSKLGDNQKE
jgi:hypothetical protein